MSVLCGTMVRDRARFRDALCPTDHTFLRIDPDERRYLRFPSPRLRGDERELSDGSQRGRFDL